MMILTLFYVEVEGSGGREGEGRREGGMEVRTNRNKEIIFLGDCLLLDIASLPNHILS